ncbi:MAG: MFS transporter [Deltaproteobacteria bacterium]|nr:MFS transporter [Deltaproteobacteria bacterium]
MRNSELDNVTNTNAPQKPTRFLQNPFLWTGTTYFAEGLPFSLVRQISSVFFKDHNATLQAIGLTSLYGLPWTLKFLWAPFIESVGTKRKWLCLMQLCLMVVALLMAFASTLPESLKFVAILFFVMAVLSATNDIAIDGYYMEALDDDGQAKFVGYRVMAYRLALIAGAGGIVSLVGKTNWLAGFVLAGIIFGVLVIYRQIYLPRVEIETRPISSIWRSVLSGKNIIITASAVFFFFIARALIESDLFKTTTAPIRPYLDRMSTPDWIGLALLIVITSLVIAFKPLKRRLEQSNSIVGNSFISFLDQPKIKQILLFVILYRAGESLLSSMSTPFILDIGITKFEFGIISGTIGTLCSITGTIAGGWLISRYDLIKTIWPITLAQNLTNVVYMGMAYKFSHLVGHPELGAANIGMVGVVHAIDQLAGGLGTAVFVTFLMRTCKKEYKASHFAIVSGLMSVCGTLMGVVSGFLAASFGYVIFFGLSFLASIPGMILLFHIPFLRHRLKGR